MIKIKRDIQRIKPKTMPVLGTPHDKRVSVTLELSSFMETNLDLTGIDMVIMERMLKSDLVRKIYGDVAEDLCLLGELVFDLRAKYGLMECDKSEMFDEIIRFITELQVSLLSSGK